MRPLSKLTTSITVAVTALLFAFAASPAAAQEPGAGGATELRAEEGDGGRTRNVILVTIDGLRCSTKRCEIAYGRTS